MNKPISLTDPFDHANTLDIWNDNKYLVISPKELFKSQIICQKYEDIKIFTEIIHSNNTQQVGYLNENYYTFVFISSINEVTINCQKIEINYLYIGCNSITNSVSRYPMQCLIIAIPKNVFLNYLTDPISTLFHYTIDQTISLNSTQTEYFKKTMKAIIDNVSYPDFNILVENIAEALENRNIGSSIITSDSYLFPKICHYLCENHQIHTLKISDVCTKFKISRRRLQYLFEHNLNISPQLYMRYIRLNYAKYSLIYEKDKNIQDIAYIHGINHISRFSKYFLDFYNIYPNELRNN